MFDLVEQLVFGRQHVGQPELEQRFDVVERCIGFEQRHRGFDVVVERRVGLERPGRLDLFVVAKMSRVRFLRLFPSVFRGEHTGLREVAIERLSTVRIEAEDVVAYADGERIGPLPVEVSVVPGALRVLA